MSEHDRDMLLGRIADGAGTERDWDAFRALAERDPTLWRELAEMQRDAADLTAAVGRALAVADLVEAPAETQIVARFTDRVRQVGAWGGWAAAAALTLVWATGGLHAPGPVGTNLAGMGFSTPDDALQAYLDRGQQSGQVIDELPAKVLVETRPSAARPGGVEVIYIRQIMERAVVDDLYRFSQDEFGRPAPIRVAPARVAPAGPM